jgi:hypothetical protein
VADPKHDLPRTGDDEDDGAVESKQPFGEGEGVPGGPDSTPFKPGEGPTADEETGITGDPDER